VVTGLVVAVRPSVACAETHQVTGARNRGTSSVAVRPLPGIGWLCASGDFQCSRADRIAADPVAVTDSRKPTEPSQTPPARAVTVNATTDDPGGELLAPADGTSDAGVDRDGSGDDGPWVAGPVLGFAGVVAAVGAGLDGAGAPAAG
jgi:hypothetical protein